VSSMLTKISRNVVSMSKLSHCLLQRLVKICPDFILIPFESKEVVVLHLSPCINNKLLKKLSTIKEGQRPLWPWMKMVGIVATICNMFRTHVTMFPRNGRDFIMPSQITKRKEQNIMEWCMEWIEMADHLQGITIFRGSEA